MVWMTYFNHIYIILVFSVIHVGITSTTRIQLCFNLTRKKLELFNRHIFQVSENKLNQCINFFALVTLIL